MKRVLIISYYWPPAGGIGVRRSLKFAKYLRNFGWEPIVYAPLNADYLLYDYTNLKDIPDKMEILKYPIWAPFRLFKFFSGRKQNDPTDPVHVRQKKSFIDNFAIWIRGNFFIPDARCRWINPSVKYLKIYLHDHPVDAILTDGPPHTNTAIGQRLSTELGIPWLADFQDPWTQSDYYKLYKISKWANRRHKKMEQAVFTTARKITIASPSWAKELEMIGARDVGVIYYGYDDDDFKHIYQKIDSHFTITHAGQLGKDRNPEVLFKVLKDLQGELPGFNENLKLNFFGNIDLTVRKSIIDNGLEHNFNNEGFVEHPRSIQLISGAQILLLLINKKENVQGRIPGKFYEYLRAKRPILYLGPQNTDLATIIKNYESGECIDHDDYELIKSSIKRRYKLYLQGKNYVSSKNITKFSIENQTRILSQYLDQIIE